MIAIDGNLKYLFNKYFTIQNLKSKMVLLPQVIEAQFTKVQLAIGDGILESPQD